MQKQFDMIRSESAQVASPVRIFLADASCDVQAQLRQWESSGRFEVHCFANGRHLLRRVANERPDLVLLDLLLPGIDGLTTLRLLKGLSAPVVMLSANSLEGARGTIEALVTGAADYLLKKRRNGSECIVVTPAGLLRRMDAWRVAMARDREVDAPRWFALDARAGSRCWRPLAQPFPSGRVWTGLALATSSSVRALVRALAMAPRNPAGAILIAVNQPLRFSQALRETLVRHCDRMVVELADGETLRPGQWRLLPGRRLLAVGGSGRGGWHCVANRAVDPVISLRRQVALLECAAPGALRIYLFEEPDAQLLKPLRRLAARGTAVLLDGAALATSRELTPHDPRIGNEVCAHNATVELPGDERIAFDAASDREPARPGTAWRP